MKKYIIFFVDKNNDATSMEFFEFFEARFIGKIIKDNLKEGSSIHIQEVVNAGD